MVIVGSYFCVLLTFTSIYLFSESSKPEELFHNNDYKPSIRIYSPPPDSRSISCQSLGSHTVISGSSLHHRQHSHHNEDDNNYLNTGLWLDVAQDYVNIRDKDAADSGKEEGESLPKLIIPLPANLMDMSPSQVKTHKKVMSELRDSLRHKQSPSVLESSDEDYDEIDTSQQSSSVYVDIHSSTEEEDDSSNEEYTNLSPSSNSKVEGSVVNTDYVNNDFTMKPQQPSHLLIPQVPILKKNSIKEKVKEIPMYAELNNLLNVHSPIYQTLENNTTKVKASITSKGQSSSEASSHKDNDYINVTKPPLTIKEIKANKANAAPMISELKKQIAKPAMNNGKSKDSDYINVVKPPLTIKEIKANKANVPLMLPELNQRILPALPLPEHKQKIQQPNTSVRSKSKKEPIFENIPKTLKQQTVGNPISANVKDDTTKTTIDQTTTSDASHEVTTESSNDEYQSEYYSDFYDDNGNQNRADFSHQPSENRSMQSSKSELDSDSESEGNFDISKHVGDNESDEDSLDVSDDGNSDIDNVTDAENGTDFVSEINDVVVDQQDNTGELPAPAFGAESASDESDNEDYSENEDQSDTEDQSNCEDQSDNEDQNMSEVSDGEVEGDKMTGDVAGSDCDDVGDESENGISDSDYGQTSDDETDSDQDSDEDESTESDDYEEDNASDASSHSEDNASDAGSHKHDKQSNTVLNDEFVTKPKEQITLSTCVLRPISRPVSTNIDNIGNTGGSDIADAGVKASLSGYQQLSAKTSNVVKDRISIEHRQLQRSQKDNNTLQELSAPPDTLLPSPANKPTLPHLDRKHLDAVYQSFDTIQSTIKEHRQNNSAGSFHHVDAVKRGMKVKPLCFKSYRFRM